MSQQKRKLIEVALPLEAINRESVREKNIRQGHPSTMHLWWARRPLASCRAVLFAQMVDDPSSHPDKFPTLEMQDKERQRLFGIIERLVDWSNLNDTSLFNEALNEIKKSSNGEIPIIYDPFAGGGSIPLEAQRLGMQAYASDLNPVAVLINKSLIEVPAKYKSRKPVFPGAAQSRLSWEKTNGLASDVLEYGKWMQEKAKKLIGNNYPSLKSEGNSEITPVAWVWARTVTCPNPACQIALPLVRSFWLKKDSKLPYWIDVKVAGKEIKYSVSSDKSGPHLEGTVGRTGAICISCQTPVSLKYIREQGKEVGLGVQMICMVGQGVRQKIYLPPSKEQIVAADVTRPDNSPNESLPQNPRDFKTPNYGMTTFGHLFSNRQLLALTVLSDLVDEARVQIIKDAISGGWSKEDATGYSDAVGLYLGLAVGRSADYNSSICSWDSSRESLRNTFARQAIAMTWDFAETNILENSTGTWSSQIGWISKVIENLGSGNPGVVTQQNANGVKYPDNVVISTDPPYYNNIVYADLSDFFYVWLRRSLKETYPDLFATLLTPKAEELVATPYRFDGGTKEAEVFFEDGFVKTFTRIAKAHNPEYPMTVFYAYKQTEEDELGSASTGWETMLNAIIETGFTINATWPIRTELPNRMLGSGTNALASSIVLACRPQHESASATNRRGFLGVLKVELPNAMRELQEGSIAPVDLAQAAIGPGMAIFSRYSAVLEADGSKMTVRTALALINQVLDESLSDQEGDFDADTRFCIKWFSSFGWNQGQSGEADILSRAVNTSVSSLDRGGIFKAAAGKAQLIHPKDMPSHWDPAQDKDISVWEVALRIAHTLQSEGLEKAAEWSSAASSRVDLDSVKELSYLLFSLCEKKGWTESAILFNGLGTSWSDITNTALLHPDDITSQGTLDF